MKVYYDAGLKDLAESAGHRGKTLSSISRCSSFKRTHQFLLQVWEALYRYMFNLFRASYDDQLSLLNIMSATKANLLECSKTMNESGFESSLKDFVCRTLPDYSKLYDCFCEWVGKLGEHNPNWKFWSGFVFCDLQSYLCLYLSMRGGLWNLRLSGIKALAPLFTAFDRPHYQRLIPTHLHDLLKLPTEIKKNLESGAFVCSISGTKMRSIALDEAHEMLVNKDLKTTIVHPTKEYLDRILYYYPVRSLVIKSLRHLALLDRGDHDSVKLFASNECARSLKTEENMNCMMTKLEKSKCLTLDLECKQLQSLCGQIATCEQEIDLTGFWDVEKRLFMNLIDIKTPSAQAPQRKEKLLTFASSCKAA